ncbi:MAG: hypothetical protein GXP14_15725 [Gammaproteobacteria bacterium]|nr:hypothetical protein [Gammaproteobacteria bacterium]
MTEVLLFDKVMRPDELYRACRLTPKQLYYGDKFGALVPYKPYVLGDILHKKHSVSPAH